jgi:hypothetical protein
MVWSRLSTAPLISNNKLYMFASDEEISARVSSGTNLVNRPPVAASRRVLTNAAARKAARQMHPDILFTAKNSKVELSEEQLTGSSTPSQEEDEELLSTNTDVTTIAPLNNGGRRPGDKNLPDNLRSIIGAVAHLDTTKNTAEAFGVSTHHVHELKHGMHSTAQGQDDKLVDAINEKLEEPHDIAVKKLAAALTYLDITKLDVNKPKDVVHVAKQLSSIAEQTSPIKKDDPLGDGGTRLVVYAPTFKQENKYETTHVVRAEETKDA